MGRRSKADIYNLGGEIVELHDKEKLSHEEISKKIQEDKGLDISREASRRAYNSSKLKAEKYVIAAESSKMILDSVKDGTNTDLVEDTINFILNLIPNSNITRNTIAQFINLKVAINVIKSFFVQKKLSIKTCNNDIYINNVIINFKLKLINSLSTIEF